LIHTVFVKFIKNVLIDYICVC